MKKKLIVLSVSLIVSANAHAFEDVARVTHVVPINETVNHPSQKCWTEYQQTIQTVAPQRDYGGAVLGTIIGGTLGSRVGKGRGKLVGTAAGAAIGAIAGDRMANGNAHAETRTVTTPVQHCETVDNFETRTTGYNVTYEYDHRTFTTRLPYHPGNRLRVSVAVTPR